MKGYLKQINRFGDTWGIYLFPIDVEEEIIRQAFIEYMDSDEDDDIGEFEIWWNKRNSIKIERVFAEEIYI